VQGIAVAHCELEHAWTAVAFRDFEDNTRSSVCKHECHALVFDTVNVAGQQHGVLDAVFLGDSQHSGQGADHRRLTVADAQHVSAVEVYARDRMNAFDVAPRKPRFALGPTRPRCRAFVLRPGLP